MHPPDPRLEGTDQGTHRIADCPSLGVNLLSNKTESLSRIRFGLCPHNKTRTSQPANAVTHSPPQTTLAPARQQNVIQIYLTSHTTSRQGPPDNRGYQLLAYHWAIGPSEWQPCISKTPTRPPPHHKNTAPGGGGGGCSSKHSAGPALPEKHGTCPPPHAEGAQVPSSGGWPSSPGSRNFGGFRGLLALTLRASRMARHFSAVFHVRNIFAVSGRFVLRSALVSVLRDSSIASTGPDFPPCDFSIPALSPRSCLRYTPSKSRGTKLFKPCLTLSHTPLPPPPEQPCPR